jgi:hypothetical protein
MLVKNNTLHQIHCCAIINGEEANHTLIPGLNEVDQTQWSHMRKHPITASYIENDDVEELTPADENTDLAEDVKALVSLKQKDAVATVKQTIDGTILNKWLESETRGPVKKAITEQLKALEIKPEDYREKGDEEEQDAE